MILTKVKHRRLVKVGLILGLLALISLFSLGMTPDPALAKGPRGGRVIGRLPHGYSPVRARGGRYYYHGGHFFRRNWPGFVVSAAIIGAVVALLPPWHTTVVVAGETYYNCQGTYYRRVPTGYMVVPAPAPAPVVVSQPVPVQPAATSSVTVTAPALNVRQGPGQEYNIIAVVQQGYTLPVHAAAPGWLYIKAPTGQFGWIDRQFTSPAGAPASG